MRPSCCLIARFLALTALIAVDAAATEDHFLVTELAPDLLMLSTDQGSYCTNSLVFTGGDGVLLVDTHSSGDAEALKEFVAGLGLGAPRIIINTHRHVEHIGGNALWGADPQGIAHHLFPEKLRSGTFLFNEYPPESLPEVTVADSLEITFNGETIRLVTIGGSHDDNEIMVHFTQHRIAHVSSVVNGFNFPSVDGDGNVMEFEPLVRRLMTLLPPDTRLVSGHNGQATGFDFVGRWDQLAGYADMMKATVEIGRRELAAGRTQEQMQEAGVFDEYSQYAGSYVDTDGWIEYVVHALTVPRETRKDVCKPVYAAWKAGGARAAVDRYRELNADHSDQYDCHESTLLSIGAKLYGSDHFDDACAFLLGSNEIYPEAQYRYYTHYVLARSYQALERPEDAREHCRLSLRLNPDFAAASRFMEELEGGVDDDQ